MSTIRIAGIRRPDGGVDVRPVERGDLIRLRDCGRLAAVRRVRGCRGAR